MKTATHCTQTDQEAKKESELDKLAQLQGLEPELNGSEIAELFSCPVCLDLLSYPVLLPCGHVLCGDCCARLLQTRALQKCPLCTNKFSDCALRAVQIGEQTGHDPRETHGKVTYLVSDDSTSEQLAKTI